MSRIIGFATTPREVVALLAQRRYALGLTQAETDYLAGTSDRYLAKVEAGMKGLGDMSLSSILGVLGLRLAVIEDEAGIPRATQRFIDELPDRRQSKPVRHHENAPGAATAPAERLEAEPMSSAA